MQGQHTTSLQPEKSKAPGMHMDQLDGPSGMPLLGNLLQLSGEKLHQVFETWSAEFGSIFKIRLGNKPVVVITNPESIQYVLKNRPEKFRRLAKMDEVIREMGVMGIFNAEGEDWKYQRKIVSQGLNLYHLKNFFPSLISITGNLLQRWNELSAQDCPLEIKSELTRYTVDVTSRLAFGYNMNTIGKKEDAIQQHLEIIFPALFKRINSPLPYWRFIKLPADRKLQTSLDAIRKTMNTVIDQTREELKTNPELNKHPANFLQALLASEKENPVSNNMIQGNVVTLLLAGEDTTAHTLAWIFYFLHLHPGVQKKIREEADRVLGDDNLLRNYDDIADMPYIEAVAFEAMRLKPVAPVLYFDTLEDVVVDGVEIPKDTAIFLETHFACIQDTHFSNPEKFIPERWLQGGCPTHQAHNEKAFVPFGAGPRFCPGYKLAMLEIVSVVAMVCKNFVLKMETSPADVNEILAFTMMPSAFMIRLVQRR